MFESIFTQTTDAALSLGNASIIVAVSLVLGFLVSVVYILSFKKEPYSRNFAITIGLLPAMVAAVIMLVGSNVARAFSLAGIFSLVRFRSVQGNSRDISYVFFTMTVGLACGLGSLTFAAFITVIVSLAFLAYYLLGYGIPRRESRLLKITIPENLNYEDAFTDLFDQYLVSHRMQSVRTTNLGTLFELNYNVILKENVKEKDFIDAIRCRNGNLNILLCRDAQDTDRLL